MKGKSKPIKKFGERLNEMFDMPADVVLDMPKVTVVSDNNIVIENFNAILEYSDSSIKVKAKDKIISVCGRNMYLLIIADNCITAEGAIECVRWE